MCALLRQEADLDVVGEAGSTEAALRLARRSRPSIVLARLPVNPKTLDWVRDLTTSIEPSDIRVVMICDRLGQAAPNILSVPGCSVLARSIDAIQLIAAIRLVAVGYFPIDASLVGRLAGVLDQFFRIQETVSATRLTETECAVLALLACGCSNREAARALAVAESTIKTHVRRMLSKLGLRDRLQLVVFAYQTGLVPVPLSQS
jgi:DNA-binding NarL/FixJ family response regulator